MAGRCQGPLSYTEAIEFDALLSGSGIIFKCASAFPGRQTPRRSAGVYNGSIQLAQKTKIMTDHFEQYAEKGNAFLKRLAQALGNPGDRAHAFRVTVAVLHTLRDRIQTEESLHLISQLPMALKGLYVDGWKINSEVTRLTTTRQFLDAVRSNCGETAGRDFGDDLQATNTISAFFAILGEYVDQGELKDLRAQLPMEIASLVQ